MAAAIGALCALFRSEDLFLFFDGCTVEKLMHFLSSYCADMISHFVRPAEAIARLACKHTPKLPVGLTEYGSRHSNPLHPR